MSNFISFHVWHILLTAAADTSSAGGVVRPRLWGLLPQAPVKQFRHAVKVQPILPARVPEGLARDPRLPDDETSTSDRSRGTLGKSRATQVEMKDASDFDKLRDAVRHSEDAPAQVPPTSSTRRLGAETEGFALGWENLKFPAEPPPPKVSESGFSTGQEQKQVWLGRVPEELDYYSQGLQVEPLPPKGYQWGDSSDQDQSEDVEDMLVFNANRKPPGTLQKALRIAREKRDVAAEKKITLLLKVEEKKAQLARQKFDADQVQRVRKIQRLKALEEIKANLPEREASDDLLTNVAWAAAAGLTVGELEGQIQESLRAREELVERSMSLVIRAVRGLKRSQGGYIDRGTTESDLVQEGCLALLQAAESYDPSFGARFNTFAYAAIKRKTYRALLERTRVVRVPEHVQIKYRKIRGARNALSAQSGRTPSDEDVCRRLLDTGGLALTPAQLQKVVESVERHAWPLSLDSPVGDGKLSVLDLQMSDELLSAEEEIIQGMVRAYLEEIMSEVLNEDEMTFLTLRFGVADGQARTIAEVGELLGLPTHNVAKGVYRRVLNKMRRSSKLKRLFDEYMERDVQTNTSEVQSFAAVQ